VPGWLIEYFLADHARFAEGLGQLDRAGLRAAMMGSAAQAIDQCTGVLVVATPGCAAQSRRVGTGYIRAGVIR
jgi:hypothetical protein